MTAATNAIPPLPAFDGRAVINGHRVSAMDGQTFECISPVDGRVIAHIAEAGQAEVDAAVKALGEAPTFKHLLNFNDLHKSNVSRAYLRFEAGQ